MSCFRHGGSQVSQEAPRRLHLRLRAQSWHCSSSWPFLTTGLYFRTLGRLTRRHAIGFRVIQAGNREGGNYLYRHNAYKFATSYHCKSAWPPCKRKNRSAKDFGRFSLIPSLRRSLTAGCGRPPLPLLGPTGKN